MSVKDEDGFRAWQRLKQRFEPGLAARQGIVNAEFSGMVARSQEPWRVHCIVDRDGPQDEVGGRRDRGGSQQDARAVSTGGDPGSCDSPTHRHEPLSHEALKKIVQEFANISTTGQEAMQIERFETGATAPTTD